MGITNIGLETAEYWKTWSAIPVAALPRTVWVIGKQLL